MNLRRRREATSDRVLTLRSGVRYAFRQAIRDALADCMHASGNGFADSESEGIAQTCFHSFQRVLFSANTSASRDNGTNP